MSDTSPAAGSLLPEALAAGEAAAMTLAELPALFLDVQTTSGSPAKGRILEVAWAFASARDAKAAVPASRLLRGGPGEPAVPRRILQLTGLSTNDLDGGVAPEAAFEALLAIVAAARPVVTICHFARFEASFVTPVLGDALPPYLCTHALAKRMLPTLPTFSLRAVASALGLDLAQEKRAADHVHATLGMWASIVERLARDHGVTRLGELAELLASDAPARTARAYPLAREERLAIADVPGIYRFLSASGRVLYVGKATSLKSRVNSYFRQQRGHSSQKFELLARTVNVETTECGSVLEAELLESDEIKRLAPPYNVALQVAARACGHVRRDFAPCVEGEAWALAPFGHREAMTPLLLLGAALAEVAAIPGLAALFYRPLEARVLLEGVAAFAAALPERLRSGDARALAAAGMWQLRALLAAASDEAAADVDAATDEGEVESEVESEVEGEVATTAAAEEDRRDVPLTVDEVVATLASVPLAAARELRKARALAQLANADVWYRETAGAAWRLVVVRAGQIARLAAASPPAPLLATPSPRGAWLLAAATETRGVAPARTVARFDIATYDRLRTLWSALTRTRNAGGVVLVALALPERAATTHGAAQVRPSAAAAPRRRRVPKKAPDDATPST